MDNKIIHIKWPGKTIVTLTDNEIIIDRKGIANTLTRGFVGSKTIPYKSITAVQLLKPNLLTNGYIQFSILGGNESLGGLTNASKDENTIMFTKTYLEEILEIKEMVESRINKQSSDEIGKNPLEQIKDLKELLDLGAISNEEFDFKKRELLNIK